MPNLKTVYQYDQGTKEYVATTYAQESPLQPGVWALPPNTVEIAPPNVGQFQKQVWNDITKQWEIKSDYRTAKVYSTSGDNIGREIKLELGQDLGGNTLVEPPKITKLYEELAWQGYWVIVNNPTKAMDLVRNERNRLLSQTDWLVLRHRDELERGVETTLTSEQYIELLNYRQALRDLPEDPNLDVFNPVYPSKPTWFS